MFLAMLLFSSAAPSCVNLLKLFSHFLRDRVMSCVSSSMVSSCELAEVSNVGRSALACALPSYAIFCLTRCISSFTFSDKSTHIGGSAGGADLHSAANDSLGSHAW